MNTKTKNLQALKLEARTRPGASCTELFYAGTSETHITVYHFEHKKVAAEMARRWNDADRILDLENDLQKEVALNRGLHEMIREQTVMIQKIAEENFQLKAYNKSLVASNKKPSLKRLWDFLF